MSQPNGHESVLLRECLELLAPCAGDLALDATLGGGGHAEALLQAIAPNGRLLGIDRDPTMLERTSRRLQSFGNRFIPCQANHENILRASRDAGVEAVDRILFDLGFSSLQMDDGARGFSFRLDGPLDMRMDRTTGPSAAELLADRSEEELSRIFWRYGEERRSRAIARAIVERRGSNPLTRTVELARLVEGVLGPAAQRFRIHPATRTFQALRIAVNGELDRLTETLTDAVNLLRPSGRIAVIAFHSLEDRIVKRVFRSLAHPCSCPPRLPVCACGKIEQVRLITSRPVRPSDAETQRNPRARSARLRVAEKL